MRTSLRWFVLLLVVLSYGCKTHSLGSEWRPLKRIRESEILAVGVSTKGARTLATEVIVRNLSKWLKLHPEPLFTAALKHELVHAQRQKKMGFLKWTSRYLTDKKFMWEEEQLGYYEHLIYLKRHGVRIVFESWAKNISNYLALEGRMVSYKDAHVWILAVWAGQWKPPQ